MKSHKHEIPEVDEDDRVTPMKTDWVSALGYERCKLQDSYGGTAKTVKYSSVVRLRTLFAIHCLCFHANVRDPNGGIKKFVYSPADEGPGGEGISKLPYTGGDLPFFPLLRWAKPGTAEISARDVNDAHILFYAHGLKRDERQFATLLQRPGKKELVELGKKLREIYSEVPIKD